jgi:bacterial/archaeal transporter family protein
MKTVLMILVIIFSNAAGDVLISSGMKQIGEVSTLSPRELARIAIRVLTCRDFILGIACLSVSFFSFLMILAWAEMSFVVPATSLVYVVSILGARMFLRERVSALRWAGTLLVCLGVALICRD